MPDESAQSKPENKPAQPPPPKPDPTEDRIHITESDQTPPIKSDLDE